MLIMTKYCLPSVSSNRNPRETCSLRALTILLKRYLARTSFYTDWADRADRNSIEHSNPNQPPNGPFQSAHLVLHGKQILTLI
jgi:hypothetical protein